MNVTSGGRRKEISFPIESVTFNKDELDMVLEVITENLRGSMTDFGRSAQFTLNIDIQVHRRGKKEKGCKPKPRQIQTPTPPKPGTHDGS